MNSIKKTIFKRGILSGLGLLAIIIAIQIFFHLGIGVSIFGDFWKMNEVRFQAGFPLPIVERIITYSPGWLGSNFERGSKWKFSLVGLIFNFLVWSSLGILFEFLRRKLINKN